MCEWVSGGVACVYAAKSFQGLWNETLQTPLLFPHPCIFVPVFSPSLSTQFPFKTCSSDRDVWPHPAHASAAIYRSISLALFALWTHRLNSAGGCKEVKFLPQISRLQHRGQGAATVSAVTWSCFMQVGCRGVGAWFTPIKADQVHLLVRSPRTGAWNKAWPPVITSGSLLNKAPSYNTREFFTQPLLPDWKLMAVLCFMCLLAWHGADY